MGKRKHPVEEEVIEDDGVEEKVVKVGSSMILL